MKTHCKNLILTLFLLLLALLFTACGVEPRQAPGAPNALAVVTPTPMGAQLIAASAIVTPSIHAGIFTSKSVGEDLLIVTATLKNTGSTALQPALMEWSVVDAAGATFLRTKLAEITLKTAEQPVMPDEPIPAGATVTGQMIFDVAGYQAPLKLVIRQDENTLTSPEFTPEVIR
jgi:hypothetical protein